jgi:hypothetical protein
LGPGELAGRVNPEAALAAIHGGSLRRPDPSYENHIAKAWRIIRRLRTGPDGDQQFRHALRAEHAGPVAAAGPGDRASIRLGVEVPNWMPAPWDNIRSGGRSSAAT